MLKKILHAARAIRAARATRAACRPVIENLEDRRLFAAPVVTVPIERNQRPGQENINFDMENFGWGAPTVFEFENGDQQLLRYGFDQNVSASLDTSDLWLSNLTAGQTVTPQQMDLATSGNSAVFTFPGYGDTGGIVLPNGNYEAILNADGIENTAHEKMAADRVDHFFILMGDADQSRVVDITDYSLIDGAFNSNLVNGGWVNGDFDYTHIVDITDYFLIDSAYNTALPLPLPPDQPNLLEATASVGRGRVDLAWTAPQGDVDGYHVDGYHIDRSTDGGVTWTLHDTVNDPAATSWYEEGLDDGAKYRYRVRAFTAEAGESAATNKADVVTNLPGPGFLTTSLLASDSVVIHWSDNTDGESGYELVKIANGVETTIPLPAGTSSYRVTGLNPATSYGFRVRAVNAATQSCPSPTISLTTLAEGQPTASTNVSVGGGSDGHTLTVSWQDNSNNESGFTIQQLESDNTTWVNVASAGANETSVTIGSLYSLTDYTFRVIADAEPAAPPPGGGGVPASPPDSPPSDPADGSTGYGDGVVFGGNPWYDSTTDGVSANWSGPIDPEQPFPKPNESFTLTLHNLPAHYGLEVTAEGDAGSNLPESGADQDHVKLTVGSASAERLVQDGQGHPYQLTVTPDHTDSSATITIAASDMEAGPEGTLQDWWTIHGLSVTLLRYRLSADPKLLTVGYKEMVRVRAAKEDGSAAAGVNLSVNDPKLVEPSSSQATTGGDGSALVEMKGAQAGSGSFKLQADKGGKVKVDQPVGNPRIQVLPGSSAGLVVGSSGFIRVTIRSADGSKLLSGQTVTVKPKNAKISVQPTEAVTNAGGDADFADVQLKGEGDSGVIVTHKESNQSVEIPYKIDMPKVSVTVPPANKGQLVFATLKVTDQAGNPARGVEIDTPEVEGDVATADFGNGGRFSGQQGEVILRIQAGNTSGTAKLKVKAKVSGVSAGPADIVVN